MQNVTFHEANTRAVPPSDLEESQCHTAPIFHGTVERGSVEGAAVFITAWKPDEHDLARLNAGGLLYVSMLGVIAAHMTTTTFEQAVNPA